MWEEIFQSTELSKAQGDAVEYLVAHNAVSICTAKLSRVKNELSAEQKKLRKCASKLLGNVDADHPIKNYLIGPNMLVTAKHGVTVYPGAEQDDEIPQGRVSVSQIEPKQ